MIGEVAGIPDDPGTLLCILAVVVVFAVIFYVAADRRP